MKNSKKISYPHRSTLGEQLAKKIEKDTGLVCDPETFRRTYAGYWQKSNGAYVWAMRIMGSPFEIGSGDPATECVKKTCRLCISTDNWGFMEIVAEKIKEAENEQT